MTTTDAMKEVLGRDVPRVPALRGTTIVTLFYEASTRTRASFELAGKALGADVINITASGSSVEKGESLDRHGAHAAGHRRGRPRHAPRLVRRALPRRAARRSAAVINAGDGWHAHPTQALLDLYTMRAHLGDLRGKRKSSSSATSRTAASRAPTSGRSPTMGAEVVVCAPPTLLPARASGSGPSPTSASPRAAAGAASRRTSTAPIEGADVVMTLRLQKERMHGRPAALACASTPRLYQVNDERLPRAKPGALVMHPGPMNEGVEISPRRRAQPAVRDRGAGDERRRRADGAALPACATRHAHERRLPSAAAASSTRRTASTPSRDVADRRRPHRRGRPRRRQRRGETIDASGLIVCAGLRRPAHAPARARLRVQGDDRDRHAGGGARRLHDRLRDAEHRAADRLRGRSSSSSCATRRRRGASCACCRSAASPRAAPGKRAGRAGRAGRRRLRRLQRRRRAGRRRARSCAARSSTPAMLGLPVIDHCEDPALAADGVMHEGWVSTRLGLRGMPAAAEETMVARDIALAEATGAHVHIAHVSTAGAVELDPRRRRRAASRVTAEVTPHHLTLTARGGASAPARRRAASPTTRTPR